MTANAPIVFEINNYEDRQNIIRGLANAGYKIWCTDTQRLLESRYFVHVEIGPKSDKEEGKL